VAAESYRHQKYFGDCLAALCGNAKLAAQPWL